VLVHDPYADPARLAADGVQGVALEDLLRRSSIVSLHARVTDETRGLLGRERLALLPRGAFLVNTARGELLDYAVLPELLDSGALGGVALDVYDPEPPAPDWELLRRDRVLATPHLAGASRQTAERAARITAGEAGRFVRGEPLLHLANPEVMEVLA
jgi:D-3-phosphoglycerate dehydrogenase